MSIAQSKIVEEARSFRGVRYLHAGRNRYGLDCVGLPIAVGVNLGLLPHDYRTEGYGRTVNVDGMRSRIAEFCDEVLLTEVEEGDLLLMRVRRSPQHIAIVTQASPLRIIHACTSLKCVAEQLVDAPMRDCIDTVFRFREAS